MVARPLNRLRLRDPAIGTGGYIDLRDHRGPMRKKPNGSGPRRVAPPEAERSDQLRETKFFGSPAFRRLWISQVLSSLGDWIGIVALTAISYDIAGTSGLSLVIGVRLGLAFVLASFAGVLVDRLNRKRIMVACDIGRALVFCALPFVDSLWQLMIAALTLEALTLLWAPAKEASVPNLVSKDFLPTANSLSLVAAYGPLIVAGFIYTGLQEGAKALSGTVSWFDLSPNSVAFLFDGLSYLASALVIATLALPQIRRSAVDTGEHTKRDVAKQGVREAIEGILFVVRNAQVRSVVFGLGAALMGGGSLVPLGVIFAEEVLNSDNSGYGVLFSTLGFGLATGIIGLTVLQKRKINTERFFAPAICLAGTALAAAATMNSLTPAAAFIAILGLCAGAVYVLGFTSLQSNVDDELRGRVFATFYTVTRVCILLALTAAPFVAGGLDRLSNRWFGGSVDFLGNDFALPGVRLTLWLSAAIIIVAGVFALLTIKTKTTADEEA